jgi:hypothetical protein
MRNKDRVNFLFILNHLKRLYEETKLSSQTLTSCWTLHRNEGLGRLGSVCSKKAASKKAATRGSKRCFISSLLVNVETSA